MAEKQGATATGDAESPRRRRPIERIRTNRHVRLAYRTMVAVVGVMIVAVGLALVPLPGPGWLIVFAGLALLATEFAWAERLLARGRGYVHGWSEWVKARSLITRIAIGAGSLAAGAGALWLYLRWQGLPDWLPLV